MKKGHNKIVNKGNPETSNDFVDIGDVRITPPRIEFTESVCKKKYQSQFILQNVGKNKVFIRIPQVDTKDFELEFLPRGNYLFPGLRIIKVVKLNYSKQCSRECAIHIYVNETKYDYLLTLKSKITTISVNPKVLDFGLLNAGNIHVALILLIENDGDKDHAFIVDLAKCSQNVIVEPTRGRVKAHAIYEIGIKVVAFVPLEVDTEFQIKCAHQTLNVPVKAKIIISKIESLHPNATRHFTLLEFPPTYFGLSSEVSLFVRNYSAIPYMFATMGEICHKRVDISEMKQKSDQFKFFNIYPEDGSFESNETKVFKFRFSPMEVDLTTRLIPCYVCTFLMHRFKCTSLNKDNMMIDFNFDLISYISQSQASSSYDPTLRSSETNILELLSSCHLDEEEYYRFNLESVHDFIRIHLYATAEVASVHIIPDEINIENMQPNVCERRTLEFQNMSRRLPIIIKYNKSAFISLSDDKLYLEPLERREISVQIGSPNIGNKTVNLTFDLMYYNEPRENGSSKVIGKTNVKVKFGIVSVTKYPTPVLNPGLTPNYIKEVGKHCHGIKFNTPLKHAKCITIYEAEQLDKKCEDLVAFPNDTQQSLRPCRSSEKYRSIFTRQSRYVAPLNSQYEMQEADILHKNKLQRYYTNYVRERSATKSKSSSEESSKNDDYDIVPGNKLLCRDVKLSKPPSAHSCRESKEMYFLPLTPREMNKIIVLPAIVKTKQIACNHTCDFRIKIVNRNDAPIQILLCSDKLNLTYDEGNRHTIEKKQERLVKISYRAGSIGYYTSNLYLIVNDSTVLNVPILADVVPLALNTDRKKLLLKSINDHQYIELRNEINVDVPYYWNVEHQNFVIEPSSGNVSVKGKIVCVVTYRQDMKGPKECSARLLSGKVTTQVIKLSVQKVDNKLLLLKNVNFDAIPLNQPTRDSIVVKNCHQYSVTYHIKEEELPKGLMIFPTNGSIDPLGQVNIYLTAQFTNCFKFDYSLNIFGYNTVTLKVPIRGFVVFPEVVITPNIINIRKMRANTLTSTEFTIQNISKVSTKIRFDMTEYEEFQISDQQCPWDRKQMKEVYLEGLSTKVLYINFSPNAASSNLFYLPIIINDILGPPILTDVTSTRTNYYLTDSVESFQILDSPKSIPCVKIRTLVEAPKICISKTVIEFRTFVRHKEAFSNITISNPQETEEDVCIRTDELNQPVYIERTAGVNENLKAKAIVLYLKPRDMITFKISFRPNSFDFGKYHINLPIFLRSDNSLKEHNVITIMAEYHRPDFSVLFSDARYFESTQSSLKSEYFYCYRPLALSFKLRLVTLIIKCIEHLENCSFKGIGQSTNPAVRWETREERKKILDDKGSYSIEVDAPFLDPTDLAHSEQYEIQCTCGGMWRARWHGVVEASLLTAYADTEYRLTQCDLHRRNVINNPDSFPSYPLFPEPSYKYIKFITGCCECAELWLQTQVLFGLWTYSIPDAINVLCLEPAPEQALERQTQLSRLPILHILGNILGPEILTTLKQREIPTDEIEKVKALYEINQRAIELMANHGASLIVIRPEHLLSFDDFLLYYKEIYEHKEYPYPQSLAIKDVEEFYRFSKQCWLDIVLQIYKALYMKRLLEKYKISSSKGKLKGTPLEDFFSTKHERIRTEFYNESESLILNWLQFHYNGNKSKVWAAGHKLPNLSIDFYNNTLNNGLVFATIIVTYCPFLRNYVEDVYLSPSSHEETYHNVVRVIQCLEMLNYTFTITPEHIIEGHSIRLLMFSTYLFEVLPPMYPIETITMKADLSTVTTRKLEVWNENDFVISYKTILIGIPSGCFRLNTNLLEIPKGKKSRISIRYFAKFAKTIECVLLLSGEVLGYRYANNKCVTLIGIPNVQYPCSIINHSQEFYKVEYYDFIVQSPYKAAATYDMNQTYDNTYQPLELVNVIYNLDSDRIACARVVILNKSFDFDDKGQCTIHSVVGTLSYLTIQSWLHFKNATLGDFAIKIVSMVKETKQKEPLNVRILSAMTKTKGMCSKLSLDIPNRNGLFFNCMKSLLVKLTEEEESELWKRVTATEMGTNLLESLFTPTLDSALDASFRCKSKTYNVIMDKNVNLILPKTVVFEEECSAGFTQVPLTVKNVNEPIMEFSLTLDSKESYRKRYYNVHFSK